MNELTAYFVELHRAQLRNPERTTRPRFFLRRVRESKRETRKKAKAR